VRPAGTTYDDGDWRALNLPHDWAVEGPFDAQENRAQGYRPRGVGWYRRYLRIEPAERGRQFELQFDAIATHATVWVNGILVHRNWSGYNGSNINITPYLRYGDEMNTIAVRADAVPMEGWWYEGAGIYRHAWLVKRAPLHIATDGLHATPRRTRRGVGRYRLLSRSRMAARLAPARSWRSRYAIRRVCWWLAGAANSGACAGAGRGAAAAGNR
jgi:beta-galactosidase